MHLRSSFGALTLVVLATACASGGSSAAGSGTAPASSAPTRGNASLITQAEIEASNLETIYDVIERLRPNMLRTRGQIGRVSGAVGGDAGASSSTIKVYHNGSSIGDTSMLRSIQANSVKQVQFLSAADATTRFGTGVDAGVILVTSK